MEEIKVIDISGISVSKEDINSADKEAISKLLGEAFQEIGFVYIKNHGIDEEIIRNAFTSSMEFFSLPSDVKEKFTKDERLQGWVCQGREIFDQDEEGSVAELEVRETYDLKNISPKGIFPDSPAPSLRPSLTKLCESSLKLASRLMECISLALNKDEQFLEKIHQGMLEQDRNGIGNATTLRSIHYPPLRDEDIRPGIIRCGEHSDYGTITLLFQDSMGGLEVKSIVESWVPANPIQGTILINVGDLLENLTGGRFPATKHRIRIPEEEMKRRCKRQSIAFFVHPDDEELISPLSGPDPRYPPITAIQHLANRFGATYGDDFGMQKEN